MSGETVTMTFPLISSDDEVQRMLALVTIFGKMDPEERARAVGYLAARYTGGAKP